MHYSFVQCSLKGTRSELDFDEFNLEFALGSVHLGTGLISSFVVILPDHVSHAFAISW